MARQTKQEGIPELRFPEFQNSPAWEQRKLGEVIKRVSKTIENSELPTVEYEDVISGEGRLNKNIFEKVSDKKGISFQNGDVLFGKLRPYLQNWLLANFEGIAVGDWWVLRSSELESSFVYSYIQTNNYQTVANLSTGTKMPRSDWKVVSNSELSFPTLTEQTAIGNFFQTLDRSIALHQRELENIKNRKKSLLQKMFPKNGENIPEIRFPEFENAPAWEQRKLGEITKSYSGGTPSVAKKEYYGGTIPFIRSAEINSDKTELFLTELGIQNSSAKMVNKGDILYALYGATSGEVGISQINGAINQAILAIIPNSSSSSNFLMQWLRAQKTNIVEKYLQGGQGNLSGSIIKSLDIPFPTLSEQTAIGDFFQTLDRSIALHQRKLDHLKLRKKALLQKMFP